MSKSIVFNPADLEASKNLMLEDLENAKKDLQEKSQPLSFENGYAKGVEHATLYVLATMMTGISENRRLDEIISSIQATTELNHLAAHTLRGLPPTCAAIDQIHDYQGKITADLILSRLEKALTQLDPQQAKTSTQKLN